MPYHWPFSNDPNPSFLLMSFRAGQIWNATKPATTDVDLIQPVSAYAKIIAKGWTKVGCDWSRDCMKGEDRDGDDYVLYCQFG
jgi:hypothetical protein